MIASPLFSAIQSTWTEIQPLLLPLLSGALAIYLLLPRPRPYPTWIGVLLGAVALLTTGASVIRLGFFSAESFLFYAFSALAVLGGSLLVTQHNPARAALSFALVVLSTAGLFLLLAAPFLMAATIIIYAGAIIVTFLFVLMLAQQEGRSDADDRSREPLLATLTGFVLLGAICYLLNITYGTREIDQLLARTQQAAEKGSKKELIDAVGPNQILFKEYEDLLISYNLTDLSRRLFDEVQTEWLKLLNKDGSEPQLQKLLRSLETIGTQARARLGSAQPRIPARLMSDKSGPPSAVAADQVRRDPDTQVPQLPAENSAYLGRSLFTDYLLPVELGGLLLLVAVVGSIAIAQRASPERTARP